MQTTTIDHGLKLKRRRGQFSLRSLLAAVTWLALILAICLNYQHALTRQRQRLESLQSAGAGVPSGWPMPQVKLAPPPTIPPE